MWKTILRRFLILIVQLIVLSVLIFVLAQFMPGDALRGRLYPGMHPDLYDRLVEMYGLNDPLPQQYFRWLGDIVLRGDFGESFTFYRPVTTVIGERMGNTMRLSLVTTFFTYLIALPLALLSARYKGRAFDKATMVYTFFALSTPTLVFGLVNILVFAYTLDWFPPLGAINVSAYLAGGWAAFWSRLEHLILPALTLAILSTTGTIYFLRNELIDNDSADFVTTAHSKGVPEKNVYSKHILRNALLPIAGQAGVVITGLFAGSIFIERVFTFQGMGQLFLESIMARDFPVANALIMFYGVLTALAILITDIVITVIDPRIRIK